jgi:hypothetical protein
MRMQGNEIRGAKQPSRQETFAAETVKNKMNFDRDLAGLASYKLQSFALLPRGDTPTERCPN